MRSRRESPFGVEGIEVGRADLADAMAVDIVSRRAFSSEGSSSLDILKLCLLSLSVWTLLIFELGNFFLLICSQFRTLTLYPYFVGANFLCVLLTGLTSFLERK